VRKEGIIVQQDKDAEKILNSYGAEAAYLPNTPQFPNDPPVLLLREHASRSAVIEELLHLGQHRKTKFSPEFYTELVKYEIEAQEKLLKLGERLGWTSYELNEIEKALNYWRTKK
jgi:hypothetical protein